MIVKRAIADGGKRSMAEKTAADRYRDMTETPVPRLITRLSIPTIISMLVTALYNAADTFFVGRISTEATAAVGLAFSLSRVAKASAFSEGVMSRYFIVVSRFSCPNKYRI